MRANPEQLLIALQNMAEFLERVGVTSEAKPFKDLHARLLVEERASKELKEAAWKAKRKATLWIISNIRKQPWDDGKKKQVDHEFVAVRRTLEDALLPKKPTAFAETEVKGLAGNDEFTTVMGDPKEAKNIADRAMNVVRHFSSAVFRQDIETAYGLCANELRNWMSVKRFVTELGSADRKYGGPATECRIERVAYLEADEVAREQCGNTDRDWPKDTPRLNKRATVGTFWLTKPAQNRGRWVFFWVTEEAKGYRIAKFQQYLQ